MTFTQVTSCMMPDNGKGLQPSKFRHDFSNQSKTNITINLLSHEICIQSNAWEVGETGMSPSIKHPKSRLVQSKVA